MGIREIPNRERAGPWADDDGPAPLGGVFSQEERIDKVERDLQQATNEVERLTLERDFYSKKASALAEENCKLTVSATKYSVRAQEVERELTETATKYSLWGQKLERELARIDPDGAPARRFDAQDES